MSVLVGWNSAGWRRYVGLFAALIAAVVTFLAVGRAAKPREEEPRVRMVDADGGAARTAELARIRSLWVDGRGLECLAPAIYGRDESARFAAMLFWSAPAQPAGDSSPVGVLWSRLAGVYGAGAPAGGEVALAAAEPLVVSIRRSAKYAARAEAA